jgi:hypothetical protein
MSWMLFFWSGDKLKTIGLKIKCNPGADHRNKRESGNPSNHCLFLAVLLDHVIAVASPVLIIES